MSTREHRHRIRILRLCRGACRGEILTRTQINNPSDIKTHLGKLMTEKLICILKILMNEKKNWAQEKKGTFSQPGHKGWCLSTTWGLSVHVPDCQHLASFFFYTSFAELQLSGIRENIPVTGSQVSRIRRLTHAIQPMHTLTRHTSHAEELPG